MKVPKYYKKEFESFFAEIYDFCFNLFTFFQIKKLRKKVLNLLKLKKGYKVLDLACGTGEFTILISKLVDEHGKVIGIDLSQRMLDIAINKSKSISQINYFRKNFEQINYKNIFDAVVIGLGAHEVPSVPRLNMYKQAYKVLKPKGQLLIFDYVSSISALLKPFYWLYLKTIEHPNGWEYINENHSKVLRSVGFRLIKYKKIAYLFEVSVYKKE